MTLFGRKLAAQTNIGLVPFEISKKKYAQNIFIFTHTQDSLYLHSPLIYQTRISLYAYSTRHVIEKFNHLNESSHSNKTTCK
jgi:hypothetical protein